MDIEQDEIQFLGFFGIYKEAYKIISSWKRIFTQISLTLILPLSFIFLLHIEVSSLLFSKIIRTETQLDETRAGTPRYNRLSDLVSSEWIYFCLFKVGYFTFFFILSLLSTAAVVYTIASIYTAREVRFNKVMSVVPKVWKRLMVTFLCIFFAFFAYAVSATVIIIGCTITFDLIANIKVAVGVFDVLLVLYFLGVVYMSLIWQLASVVSVLEEAWGFQAMKKSRALMKGKTWVALAIFFILNLLFGVIQTMFQKLVVHGRSLGSVSRVMYGTLCFFLLSLFFLVGLVIQTVIYFVCKSYHHENIDKSALSDHLEVYMGDYVPLKSKDVQLEQVYV